jgi:threonine/homoserine efflux transporter RhtA
MKIKTIAVWLTALALPVVVLIGAQIDTASGPSIGGGGYDLGPFLYSWLLVIVTGVWSLCTCAASLLYRDRASSRQALILTAIGITTLAMVLVFYRDNLS